MLNEINNIKELRKLIETKAYHPFLQKYIEKPVIDEDKLLLLWGLFNELEISTDERNHYMLSMMLVQIALDTHEKVSNSSVILESPNQLKNRQLSVLAGDYYSGLYYKVLSEVGNIEMIRSLSSAVKKINDHKILLYQHTLTSLPSFSSSVKAVESSLIYKIAEVYQQTAWMKNAENILLLKRLLNEKELFITTGQSILFESLRLILFPNSKDVPVDEDQMVQVKNAMDSCIENAIQAVIKSKDELPLGNVELHQRIENLLSSTKLKANSYVKEG